MNNPWRKLGLPALAAMLLAPACGKDEQGNGEGDGRTNFDIKVAALNLEDVNGVRYKVTVKNATPEVVWSRDNLDSTQFGDNVGSISYVGPCDAQANPHTIELELLEMRSGPTTVINPNTYRNPAPPGDPIIVTAECVENADVPVTINLTIMRNANQGFFDIGVTFDDIFCSAKFDCRRNGQTFDFLHNPATDERDISVILGFACTAGGDGNGGGENTWLHMSNVVVICQDANNQEVQILMSPSGPEGNQGGAAPLFYQTGIYRGEEALEPYDKCYWNMAFGVLLPDPLNPNESPNGGLHSCRLLATGTASDEPFGPNGATPPGTVYPYIQWDIQLTDADGQIACGAHALNSTDFSFQDSSVTTQYTGWSGTTFGYEWECGTDTPVDPNQLACAGTTEDGQVAAFMPQPGGLTVKFGNSLDNMYYALPAGYTFGAESFCCANPCCPDQTP